jgi:hypothetical protein
MSGEILRPQNLATCELGFEFIELDEVLLATRQS